MTFFSRRAIPVYLCTLLFWSSFYIYMPILPPYAQRVGGSLQSVGWVISAYGLAQFILRIPLGIFSDRLRRRKPFVILGFFLSGIGSVGLIFSSSVPMLFLSVFTVGIGASMWVPFSVLFSSYFPAFLLGQAMSMIMFISRLSQVISNYAGGVIAEAGGWTAPFYAAGILSLIGFFLAFALQEKRPEQSRQPIWERVLDVARGPKVLWVSGLALLMQFANFSTTYGFTPIYAQQLGASKGDLGTLLFTYMVPNAVGTFLAGPIASRLNERRVVFLGFLLVAAAVFYTPFIHRLPFLYCIQALNGLGVGLIFPPLMSLAIKPMPYGQQATAMGVFQSIYAAGMTAGPAFSGWVGDQFGLSSVFLLSGSFCIVGAFLSWVQIRTAVRN
jgi:predicted MFS family arabinose efflux permease